MVKMIMSTKEKRTPRILTILLDDKRQTTRSLKKKRQAKLEPVAKTKIPTALLDWPGPVNKDR